MNKLTTRAAALAITGMLITGVALADDDDNNDVKYRQAVMGAMGSQFSAIVLAFSGRVDHPGDLAALTEALAKMATVTGTLFPAGSEGGKALPLIWEEQDKVAMASDELIATSAQLAEAAASGNKGAATSPAISVRYISSKRTVCHDKITIPAVEAGSTAGIVRCKGGFT